MRQSDLVNHLWLWSAVIAFGFLVCGEAIAATQRDSVTVGSNKVEGRFQVGPLVAVVLDVAETDSASTPSGYWGTIREFDDPRRPRTVIRRLAAYVGDDSIWVPLSAYGDLGDPTRMKLSVSRNRAELVIDGGDGDGSYTASFELDLRDWVVAKRRVGKWEEPKEDFEETVWSYPRVILLQKIWEQDKHVQGPNKK